MVRFWHKKHVVRVRKTSRFGLKYMLQSTQTQLDNVWWSPAKHQVLSPQTRLEVAHMARKCPPQTKRAWLFVKKKKSFGPHKHGWKCPPALLMEKSCHGWRCPEVSIKTPGSVCHSSSRWQRPNFPWKVLWSCPTQLEIVTSYPWKYPVVPQCESQVLNNNRCLLPMYASTCYRLRTV